MSSFVETMFDIDFMTQGGTKKQYPFHPDEVVSEGTKG